MPVQLKLLILLDCATPIVGVLLFLFSKKKVGKIIGLIIFIVSTIIFIHEGVWRMLLIWLGYL